MPRPMSKRSSIRTPNSKGLIGRYPKAVIGTATGDPAHATEMDALVAYLQMLGTLINFNDYTAKDLQQ